MSNLKETLKGAPGLEKVYFSADGEHYFNVHEHKGEKYGRIEKKGKMNDKGKRVVVLIPVESTKIVDTKDASDVLSGKKIPVKKQKVEEETPTEE